MSTPRLLSCSLLILMMAAPAIAAPKDSHRQAVTELMQMLNMQQQIDEALKISADALTQQIPPFAAHKDAVLRFYEKHMGWKTTRNDYIDLYVETFSEKEIRDLLAFYKTPTGYKVIHTLPVVMQKATAKTQKRVQDAMPELIELIKRPPPAAPAKP